jgi:hypothetical protein
MTSRSGAYDIPQLPVGIYTVTFLRDGIQRVKADRLTTRIEHTTNPNLVLQVSGLMGPVKLTDTEALDQNSRSVGTRIERKRVND